MMSVVFARPCRAWIISTISPAPPRQDSTAVCSHRVSKARARWHRLQRGRCQTVDLPQSSLAQIALGLSCSPKQRYLRKNTSARACAIHHHSLLHRLRTRRWLHLRSVTHAIKVAPGSFPSPAHGRTLLQPLWVEDLVTCLIWTLENQETLNQTHEVGGGDIFTLRQFSRSS